MSDIPKIRLFDDHILVIPDPEEEKTSGGLYVPESGQKPYITGVVKKVGPGRYTDRAECIPMDVEEDERVVYHRHHGRPIELDGTEYTMLVPGEIVGVIPEGDE